MFCVMWFETASSSTDPVPDSVHHRNCRDSVGGGSSSSALSPDAAWGRSVVTTGVARWRRLRQPAAAQKRPGEVSGGMKQRVGIARALSMEPKVLLMDEPFGALDALTRAKLQDELLEIVAKTHATVVMVTHDVDEAVLLSDKIVMMTNGPAATIGEVLSVDLPRPRQRLDLAESTEYQRYRKAVIDFLYTRQAHVEKTA